MAIRSRVLFLCVVTLSFLLDSCSSGGGQLSLQHKPKSTKHKKRPKKKPTKARKKPKATEPTVATQQQPLIIPQDIANGALIARPPTLPYPFRTRDGKLGTIRQKEGRWVARVWQPWTQNVVELPIVSKKPISKALAAMPPYSPTYPSPHVHFLRSSEGKGYLYLGKMGLAGGGDGDKKDNKKTAPLPPAELRMRRPSLPGVKKRITKGDISSTEVLVEALNDPGAKNKKDLQRWVQQYINWFDDQRPERLGEGDLEELALLANIKPTSKANKRLLRNYLKLLCDKTREKDYRDEDLIQLLNYNLQHIDPAVFEGNPKVLIDLAQDLLEKLDPEQRKQQFTASTYPSYEHMLSALHQSMVLIQQIDPASWDPRSKDSLYRQFRARLEAIKGDADYYPFVYQSELTLQGLSRLGKPLSKTIERLRKTFYGVKGGYYLYKGVRGLFSLKLDGESFLKGYSNFKEAMRGRAVKAEEWYSCLQAMSEAAALTFEDPNCYKAFEEGLDALKDLKITNKRSRKALHYGIIKQLGALALYNNNRKVRAESKKWLATLSESKEWNKDAEVREAIAVYLASASKPVKAPVQPSGRVFTQVVQSVNEEAALAEMHGTAIVPMRVRHHDAQVKEHYRATCSTLNTPLNKNPSIESAQFKFTYTTGKKHQDHQKQDSDQGSQDEVEAHQARQDSNNPSIALDEFFDDRVINGKKQPVSKVLIVGSAGYGKTTATKQIAYAFTQGKTKGEVVYRLLARNLKHHEQVQVEGSRPAIAIAHELFPELKGDNKRFQAAVSRIDMNLERGETVVIVDGADELPKENQPVIDDILRGAHKLIITSREHGISAYREIADLEVSMHALSRDQVATYATQYLGKEKAEKLLAFLSDRPALRQLASVPVTLNILCALWEKESEHFENIVGGSPTGLYSEMAHYMWERFVDKDEDPDEDLDNDDRDKLFKALGKVSIKGLEQGNLVMNKDTVKKSLREVGKDKVIKDMLQESGFLEDIGTGYAFPHLTFQEYFAGKELARMMLAGRSKEKEKALKFLKDNQYKGKYKKTITFMAGEVYKHEDGGIEGAKKLLRALKANRSLGDLQYSLLQLRCLNEWIGMEDFDGEALNELEEEFGLMKTFEGLIEEGLERIWKNTWSNGHLQGTLLGAFSELGMALKDMEAENIYKKALKDNKESVRKAAVKALGKLAEVVPEKAPEIIALLKGAVKDESWYVSEAALEALGNIAEAAPGQVPAMIPILKKAFKSKSKMYTAAQMLSKASQAAPENTTEVIGFLGRALKSKSLIRRHAAIKALYELAKALPKQMPAALPLLKIALKDKSVGKIWINPLCVETVCIQEIAVESIARLVLDAPKQASTLIAFLEDAYSGGDKKARRDILSGLDKLAKRAPDEAPELMPLIGRALKKTRGGAARVLEGLTKQAPRQAKTLMPLIKTALESDSIEAARALNKLARQVPKKAPEIIPFIVGSLESYVNEKDGVIKGLLRGLAKDMPHEVPGMIESLKGALKNEDLGVRIAAIRTLEAITVTVPTEARAIIPVIASALEDENEIIPQFARESLASIAKAVPDAVPAMIEPFKGFLKHKNNGVRRFAIWTLMDIAEVVTEQSGLALIPLVKDAMKDECEGVRTGTMEALRKLAEAMPKERAAIIQLIKYAIKNKDRWLRKYAVKELGWLARDLPGERSSIMPLIKDATKNEDEWVRIAAVKALKEIAKAIPEERAWAVPLFKDIIKDPHENVRSEAVWILGLGFLRTLSEERPSLIPLFKDASKDKHQDVRYAVVEVLGRIAKALPDKAPQLISIVVNALKDKHYKVRHNAERALNQLPLQQLIRCLLPDASEKFIYFIKGKLHKEPLVIKAGKTRRKKDLVIHLSSGELLKWTVTKERAEEIYKLLGQPSGA